MLPGRTLDWQWTLSHQVMYNRSLYHFSCTTHSVRIWPSAWPQMFTLKALVPRNKSGCLGICCWAGDYWPPPQPSEAPLPRWLLLFSLGWLSVGQYWTCVRPSASSAVCTQSSVASSREGLSCRWQAEASRSPNMDTKAVLPWTGDFEYSCQVESQ